VTSRDLDRLAERIVDGVVAALQLQRAQRKAAVIKRKASIAPRSLQLLGTPKFKPADGLYSRVAARLGITRVYVYKVAKGIVRSPRVLNALREEIARPATTATTPTTTEGVNL
jgi:hypothetical protein